MSTISTKINFESFRLGMYGTFQRDMSSEKVLPILYMLYVNSDKVNFLDFKKHIAPMYLDKIVSA